MSVIEEQEVSAVSVIKDSNVDYSKHLLEHGSYKWIDVIPQEGGNGQTVDNGGGQVHTFYAGSEYVFNPSISTLDFQINLPTAVTGGTYNWTYADVCAFLRELKVDPNSGNTVAYMQDIAHFQKIALRYLTKLEEMKSKDSNISNPNGTASSPGNNSIFYPSRELRSQNKLPASGVNAPVSYDEPQYAFQSNLVNATFSVQNALLNVSIPLKMFPETWLASNQDFYFGQQLNFVVTYEGLSNWLWSSTDANNPATGAAAATSVTANIKCVLKLACQQDPMICAKLKADVIAGKQYMIPFLTRKYKQSLSGAAQQPNCTILPSDGFRLNRMWVGCFQGTQTLNTFLDCDNTNSATRLVNYFQTQMDSTLLQQKAVYSGGSPSASQSNDDDYKILLPRLYGSCVLGRQSYYRNWFWVDDFTSYRPRSEKAILHPLTNRIDGMDISDAVHTYTFQGYITDTAVAHNWYLWSVTQKFMDVSPGNIKVY